MRILVACEYSGLVRDSFLARGHDALSCDLLPSERPGPHYQGDVRHLDLSSFDVLIAFPPCTYLCRAGARWWPARLTEQREAIEFVRWLMNAPMPRIAIENPVGIISTAIRLPTQVIQPWQFSHPETKATCLWLKNLPPLVPTCIVAGREARIHRMAPGPNRARERSKTYSGIAEAMAAQWSNLDTWPVQATLWAA